MTDPTRRSRRPLERVAQSFLSRRRRARVLLLASLDSSVALETTRAGLAEAAGALSLDLRTDLASPAADGPGVRLVELGVLGARSADALLPPCGAGPDVLLLCLPAGAEALRVQYRIALWTWSLHPRFLRCLLPDAVDARAVAERIRDTLALALDDPPAVEVLGTGGPWGSPPHRTLLLRILQSLVAASGRGARAGGARRLQGHG